MTRVELTERRRRRNEILRRRRLVAAAGLAVLAAAATALALSLSGIADPKREAMAGIASLQPDAAANEIASVLTGDEATEKELSGSAASLAADAASTSERDETREKGMDVLGAYSDAERDVEDALYASLTAVDEASVEELPAAIDDANAAMDAVKASAEDYREEIAANATGGQPTGGDVDAQIDYMMTYTTDYNSSEWGDYNDYGGDCTNFVSQGLIERGWSIDDVWYSYGDMWTASKPWIATAPMADYFDSLGLSYSTEEDLDRVRVGDVALFDWGETGSGLDHTMTVSKVEYTPDGPTVYFVGHNVDEQYRELEVALYEEHTDSSVRIYSIP